MLWFGDIRPTSLIQAYAYVECAQTLKSQRKQHTVHALVATEWSVFFAASVILVSGHKQLQIALVRVCLHWHVTGHRTNSGKGIS